MYRWVHFSADPEVQTKQCSRKVNRVPELDHVVDILGILHEIAHELGNPKNLSRDDESALVTGANEAFLCQTDLSWREVSCEPKTLRTMPQGQVCV